MERGRGGRRRGIRIDFVKEREVVFSKAENIWRRLYGCADVFIFSRFAPGQRRKANKHAHAQDVARSHTHALVHKAQYICSNPSGDLAQGPLPPSLEPIQYPPFWASPRIHHPSTVLEPLNPGKNNKFKEYVAKGTQTMECAIVNT